MNPNGIARHAKRHFMPQRNILNWVYIVTLNEAMDKKIRIKTGSESARRSGADPPQSRGEETPWGQEETQVAKKPTKRFMIQRKKTI